RPGKMIGGVVDQNEHRRSAVLSRDQLDRVVVIERVGLDVRRRVVLDIIEVLDAGRLLEAARAEERTEKRKQTEGAVAAAAQRIRQAALDVAGGDAGEKFGEAPVG